ncbi:MAG TPA: hypothetical protein VHF69_10900 [Candidatus Synoicihabitans sp.]|nr:hypothetical protein [Candidatus Synoicihabitans sp.]
MTALTAQDAAPAGVESASGGRAAAREILRQTHRYDPLIRQRWLEDVAAEEGVVKMEAFVLNESKAQVMFDRYVEKRRKAEAANKAGLVNGFEIARIPGLGVKPYQDLLPSGPPIARWTLFSVPW